jgi:hypothetical protein
LDDIEKRKIAAIENSVELVKYAISNCEAVYHADMKLAQDTYLVYLSFDYLRYRNVKKC